MLQLFLTPNNRVFIEKLLILRIYPALQAGQDEDGVRDLLAETNI